MRYKRRCKSGFLCFMSLVLCLQVITTGFIPVEASPLAGQEYDVKNLTVKGNVIESQRVNPIFAEETVAYNEDTQEQIVFPEEKYAEDFSHLEHFYNEEDAVAYIRKNANEFSDWIEFMYPVSLIGEDFSLDNLWDKALDYTEDPTISRADYLGPLWSALGTQIRTIDETYAKMRYIVKWRTTAEQEAAVDKKIKEIMASLDLDDLPDEDKVRKIYEYVCDHVEIDDEFENILAYDALFLGKSSYPGYAQCMYRLLREAGFSARYIFGNSKTHAWNIVKIGDVYYNLDAMWDDSNTKYSWFLKGRNEFKNHYRLSQYDTEEFHKKFPMAKDSWIDISGFNKPLNLDNMDFSFKAADGSELTTKANGKPKMLIFFLCALDTYSNDAIKSIVESGISGLDIYALNYMVDDDIAFQEIVNNYGGKNIIFSNDKQAHYMVGQYMELLDKEGISYGYDPFILYIDSNNKIQAVSSGLTEPSMQKAYLRYYCNVENGMLLVADHPASKTVYTGENAVFSVNVKGEKLSYQWQYKKPGSKVWQNSSSTGAKTASLTIEGTIARNGQKYRCIVTDKYGQSRTSRAAILSVKTGPEIWGHPSSQTIMEGEKAVFKVLADGNQETYQWQYSTDGKNWTNSGLTGAKTASLTVEGIEKRNGQKYRCVVTDKSGKQMISKTAVLSVHLKLSIETNPSKQIVEVGKTAVFKVKARGTGLTYQWQYKVAGDNAWKNSGMTGAKTDSLSVAGTLARNGQQYRCVVTDAKGKTVTSTAAMLVVNTKEELVITENPSNASIKEGEKVEFKVSAKGNLLTYQWQFSKDKGKTWSNSGMTGAKTDSLSVVGAIARNGQQYRCVVTDALENKVTSKAATLTIVSPFSIKAQPVSQTVMDGKNAIFKVVANGNSLSYQWQYSTDGKTWKDSGMTGAKTPNLTVAAKESRNGQQYRCVVSNALGNKEISTVATLTVKVPFAITSVPTSQTVESGQNATFSLTAIGGSLKYQWQYKAAGDTVWKNSGMTGAKTNSLSVVGTESRNGQMYRCVITNGHGMQLISNEVKLTIGTNTESEDYGCYSHPTPMNVSQYVGEDNLHYHKILCLYCVKDLGANVCEMAYYYCAKCGSACQHKLVNVVYVDDTQHEVICVQCSYSELVNHNPINGRCECGAIIGSN